MSSKNLSSQFGDPTHIQKGPPTKLLRRRNRQTDFSLFSFDMSRCAFPSPIKKYLKAYHRKESSFCPDGIRQAGVSLLRDLEIRRKKRRRAFSLSRSCPQSGGGKKSLTWKNRRGIHIGMKKLFKHKCCDNLYHFFRENKSLKFDNHW